MLLIHGPTDKKDLMHEEEEQQKITNGTNGHAMEMEQPDQERPVAAAAAKPTIRMSFSEYRRVSNLLVLHMQKLEQRKTHTPTGISSMTHLRALTAFITTECYSIWMLKHLFECGQHLF